MEFGVKAFEDEDMLPCPFCGGEAVVTLVEFLDGDVWYHPECFECDCGWQANYPTKKEAIAAWNNRSVQNFV